MIKRQNLIRLLGAFLIMFLFGSMSAVAGSTSTTKYSKAVATVGTGSGTVYVSTSTTKGTGSTSSTSATNNTSNTSSSVNHTYYYSAEPATGYNFDGWFDNANCTGTAVSATASNYSVSVTTSSTDQNSPVTKTLWAKFSVKPYISSATATKAEGDGTVYVSKTEGTWNTNTASSSATSNAAVTYYFHAVPTAGASFVGWYSDQACTTLVSTNQTYSRTVTPTQDGVNIQYYAKFSYIQTHSKVIVSAVGPGTVFVNNTAALGEYGTTCESSTTKNGVDAVHQYVMHAKEGENSTFVGWFTNAACTGTPVSTEEIYTIEKTGSTNAAAPSVYNYYAKFNTTYSLSITMKGADMLPKIEANGVAIYTSNTKHLEGTTISIQSDEYVTVSSVVKNGSTLAASAGKWTFTMDTNVELTINATMQGIPPSRWMAAVPDRAYVCNLSIPGAHQAVTEGASYSAACQDISIAELFNNGVRAYDLRPTPGNTSADGDYTNLPMKHGSINLGLKLHEAIDILKERLTANPTEFCIIMIRHENDDPSDAQINSYCSKMRALVAHANYKDLFIDFRRDLRMKDVRGKILLLTPGNRAGDRWASADVNNQNDYTHLVGGYYDGGHLGTSMLYGNMRSSLDPGTYFYIQNCYNNYSTADCRYTETTINSTQKVEAAKEGADVAAMYAAIDPEQCVWFINHTSGVSGTGLNALSKSCVYDIAKVTNPAMLAYINSNPFGTADSYGANPLGILMMDYAGVNSTSSTTVSGKDLCQAIIDTNFTDEMKGFHDGTNDVCFLMNVGTGKFLSMGANHATRAVLADHPLAMRIVRDRINNQMLMRFPGTRNGDRQGQINNFLGLVVEDGENRVYADIRQAYADDTRATMTQQVWWNVSSTEPGAEFTIDLASAKGRNKGWNGYNTSYTNFGWVGDKLDFGATGDNAKWIILTKADMAAMLEEADANNPIDITGFIANPRVENNNARHAYNKVWNITGHNNIGLLDADINRGGVEFWNREEFTSMSQKVVLTPGTYRLELDGYYRNGMEQDAEVMFFNRETPNNWPVLYAGNASTPIASVFDRDAGKVHSIPYNFDDARRHFNDDKYNTVLFFTVDGNEPKEVEIGIRKEFVLAQDWLVLNSFRLYGYGDATVNQRAYVEASADYKKLQDYITLYTRMAKSSNNKQLLEAIDLVEGEMGQATTIGEVRNLWAYLDRVSWRSNEEILEADITTADPVDGGNYYLYNVARKSFFLGGNDWGTHAVLGNPGAMVTLEKDGDNFFINTHLPNGEDGGYPKEYLGHNGYVDCPRNDRWTFKAVGDAYQILKANDHAICLASRPASNQVETDTKVAEHGDNALWKLVTIDDFNALIDEHNANFDPYKLIDVSHMIKAPGFNQRDSRDSWISIKNGDGNSGVSTGNDPEFAYEFWKFVDAELYQTIEGLRPGNYWISCNALYRPTNHEQYAPTLQSSASAAPQRRVAAAENGAELFAYAGDYNSATVGQISAVPEVGEEIGNARPGEGTMVDGIGEIPNSVVQATNFFNNGLYKVDYIENVEVGADGKLTIGVRKKTNTAEDWLVVDNFRLYYANNAEDGVTGVEDVEAEEAEVATEYYNLQGVRVENPGRGIYIRVRGEKVDKVRL